jgi:hypothetical protein
MLWFTCLLAAGYPDGVGSFRDRFRELIGKDDQQRYGDDQRDCLNELWEDLAAWSERQERYARLILPPPDERLKAIGRSYFLAHPNRADRRILSAVLADADLVGFEPPIVPVVRALVGARSRFSREFAASLDGFLADIEAGRDPAGGAFWRAIRAEAVGRMVEPEEERSRVGEMTLLATWDDDETLLIRLAAIEDSHVEGTHIRKLPVPAGGMTHFLTDAGGDSDSIVAAALDGRIPLSRGLSTLIRQGVLVFVDELAGDYSLAWGEEIDGAGLALIRQDRRDPFQQVFGGSAEESRIPGWYELEGCRIRQLPGLPRGLEGVTQLLYTTRAPKPRPIGGVRIGGDYLWSRAFQPRIRSPGAEKVLCSTNEASLLCERSTDVDADWCLPASLTVTPPARVHVRALFSVELDGRTIQRHGDTFISFIRRGHGCEYKSAGIGDYWREGCNPEQAGHAGGEAVPLDITTRDASASADLIKMDPSLRYLGPGFGEMAREPREGYVWLAIGPRKPHDLVFVGDLDSPVLPDGGESVDKADRRTWSYAFRNSGTRVTTQVGDAYVPLSAEPRLKEVLGAYRNRASRRLAVEVPRQCEPSMVDACWGHDSAPAPEPSSPAMEAAEILSALGIARSGIPLKDVQGLFASMAGEEDHLLSQQLIRGWEEAGLIDLLRRQDRSQTIVIPRVPRFVMVRRGPSVEARLIGLGPMGVGDAIIAVTQGGDVSWIQPTTRFQPPLLRITGIDPENVGEISRRVGLPEPEWLNLPTAGIAPRHLRVPDELRGLFHGAPPDAYRLDAKWDWRDMVFRSHAPEAHSDLVEVERRRHPQRCSIYVVLVDGDPMLWCHLRTWALLRAAELLEKPAFRVTGNGSVRSPGRSPMHLPLPLGRLCSLVGTGLPGPELSVTGRVCGYQYHFGSGILPMVREATPDTWMTSSQET